MRDERLIPIPSGWGLVHINTVAFKYSRYLLTCAESARNGACTVRYHDGFRMWSTNRSAYRPVPPLRAGSAASNATSVGRVRTAFRIQTLQVSKTTFDSYRYSFKGSMRKATGRSHLHKLSGNFSPFRAIVSESGAVLLSAMLSCSKRGVRNGRKSIANPRIALLLDFLCLARWIQGQVA